MYQDRIGAGSAGAEMHLADTVSPSTYELANPSILGFSSGGAIKRKIVNFNCGAWKHLRANRVWMQEAQLKAVVLRDTWSGFRPGNF